MKTDGNDGERRRKGGRMTREQAKEIFLNRGYIEVDGGVVYDGNKWREACVVISEWLKEEPIIDKIREVLTQRHQDWILCSERMPEEREWIGTKKFGTTISDEVYVTLETMDGKRFCDHIRFQNGKLSLSKQAELDAISKGTKPIAWMKFPEPLQSKDGGNELTELTNPFGDSRFGG